MASNVGDNASQKEPNNEKQLIVEEIQPDQGGGDVAEDPLAQQIPDDFYNIIFSHLDSRRDLANCSLVCKQWARVLQPERMFWRVEFLLPLILPYAELADVFKLRMLQPRISRLATMEAQRRRLADPSIVISRQRQSGSR